MAVVSPFAQIQDSLAAADSGTAANLFGRSSRIGRWTDSAQAASLRQHQKSHSTKTPSIRSRAHSPTATLPRRFSLHEQQRLAKDYQKDADPYGSADNHPGFWGKIAHGLK